MTQTPHVDFIPKVTTRPEGATHQESILTVAHYEGNKRIVRTYDFRSSTARHAFIRFTSWALSNEITFHCSPTYVL